MVLAGAQNYFVKRQTAAVQHLEEEVARDSVAVEVDD